jgi:hypothetical protein
MQLGAGHMATITINGLQRSLSDATPQWIHDQIDPRGRDGVAVCIQVKIDTSEIRIALSTPTCQQSGSGGGRSPNRQEAQVLRIWEDEKLHTNQFSVGNVIAFVKRVTQLL